MTAGPPRATDGWSFVDVLPYFRNLETDLDISDDFHGSEGPIPVRRFPREEWLPFQEAFFAACRQAGYPEDYDMNGPDSGGVGPIPMNNPEGVRMSTALTFLRAAAAPAQPDGAGQCRRGGGSGLRASGPWGWRWKAAGRFM